MARLTGLLLLLACAPHATAGEDPRPIAGPMFSYTANRNVTLWLQTDQSARVETEWQTPEGRSRYVQPATPIAGQHHAWTATLPAALLDLEPDARWEVTVRIRRATNAPDEITREGDVTIRRTPVRTTLEMTLPVPRIPLHGAPGRYRIAFGSCSHQERFGQQPIWNRILKERPDCFLFIGDNIYLPNRADEYPEQRNAVVELYRDCYDRNRQVAELQPLLRQTMSMALWDDHDFGPNNSDRTWKWADVARQTLNEYFPNNYGQPAAAGCFYKFTWGNVDVFMLDNRSFRDANRDPARKTFLGQAQLQWLRDGLAASRAPVKLIVAGNQMLADTHPHESWGNQFRAERDAFLDWLVARKIEGVVFLSGDRHFAELARRQVPGSTPLWELTSSPLANSHYEKGDENAYGDRVAAFTAGVNFGLVEIDTTGPRPRVRLSVIDNRGERVIDQVIMGTD